MQFRKSFAAWITSALVFIVCAAVASSGSNAQTTDTPKLPANYRNLIAQAVIFDFVRAGKGRPEISEQLSGQTMNFCVRFPVQKMAILLETTTGTQMRSYHMSIGRNIFGQRSFTYQGAEQFIDNPCTGTMKPFAELEALAKQVNACREKTGGNCGADGFSLPNAKRAFQKALAD
jgi:hypothetical protein